MTPRERDPAVWAATYAAAFMRTLTSAYSAAYGSTPDERMAAVLPMVDPAACSRIADAAVVALHPDGTYTAPDGTVLREPVDEGPRSYPGV